MSTTVTPLMGMTIPGVGSEPGPNYAIEINADFVNILDSHDHSTGKGTPVTVAGLNINADLPIGNNNVNNARSYRAHDSGAILTGGADINCIYPVNGDLYWNNSSGTAVKITNVASVNSTNTFYSPKAISANATILASDTFVYYGIDSTSGAVTINLPSAALITPGRFYFFKDVKGTALTNNIILSANGTDKIDGASTQLLATAYSSCMLECDGSTNWRISFFSDPQWFLGNFGRSGVALNLIGSTVNMSADSAGSINIGAASNALSFTGASYNFGFESGNFLLSSAATNEMAGSLFLVSSSTQATFSTPLVDIEHNIILGTTASDTLTINAESTFTADATVNGNLTVLGISNLDSAVTCGTTLAVTGATTLTGNLTSNGLSTFGGVSVFNNTANFSIGHIAAFAGTITSTGAVTLAGTVDLQGTIGTSGTGYISGRRILQGVTHGVATSTVDPTTTNLVYVISIASGQTFTIASGTYVVGDNIMFSNQSGVNITVAASGGSVTPTGTVGAGTSSRYVYIGSNTWLGISI